MKKSIPTCWMGLACLIALFSLFQMQNINADNPLNCACIGNDTLICELTYQISPATAGGQWSVLCDSTDGSVDFEMIDAMTTEITVSNCGEYHLIYTVNDGTCMSADTAIVKFGDPSTGHVHIDTDANLEYDGQVFCHQSPAPSSCNPVNVGGGPPPTVSWDVCATTTGSSTIFSTNVMGDMPDVCIADEITITSTDFSDFADLGCQNYSEADFLADFLDIIAATGNPGFDSLNIQFGAQCSSVGFLDTIYNDTSYVDTIFYPIPYRVGGQWNFVTDDGVWIPLQDTTYNIPVNDSSEYIILIANPGADYYGPEDNEWSAFIENDQMQWELPTIDFEFDIQWVEEFAYDTVMQLIHYDSIGYVFRHCNGFSFTDNFTISGPPSYPCGPITLQFNFATPPDPLVASLNFTIESNCGNCDGSAGLQVEGGCPPYSQTDFNGLCSGSYTFTVTDANGNVSNPVNAVINEFPGPTIDNITVIDDECEEGIGSITVTVSGGTPPYDYTINNSNNQFDNTFNGLFADTYNIEVIDANGCVTIGSATVNTTFSTMVSISGDLLICSGDQTVLTANTDAINFEWTTGATTSSIIVNSPGQYCVTVTNSDGCTAVNCATVTEINSIPIVINGNFNICPGEQAFLDVSGNFDSYQWDNGSTDPSILVGEGTYCVTVTDSGGCTGEACATVTESNDVDVNISGNLEICENEQTTITANGNFTNAQWDNGETSASIIVGEGTYCVTVTNGNGCTGENCVTVIESNEIPVFISGNLDICSGEQTFLDAGGNFSSYQWDNGSTDPSIIVGEGTYCVTVTDSGGCTGEACATVTESNDVDVNISGNLEICENEQTTITANGNFTNAQWDNGETSASIIVGEGTYCVTVTNGNGCTGENCVTVIESNEIPVFISGNLDICSGEQTFLDAGGNFSSYQWDNGSTDPSILVGEGTYCVTVTDSGGCTGEACVTVTESNSLDVFISGNLEVCGGEQTTITANGNFISAEWDNGETNSSIIVGEGTYCVTVTNGNGCTGEDCVIVTETTPPPLNVFGDSEMCEGGSASIFADNGFDTYEWDNGDFGQNIIVFNGGTYCVTATLGNCIETACWDVQEIPNPMPTIAGDTEIPAGGSVTLSTEVYDSYLWNQLQTTQSIIVSNAGTYCVTVTNGSGCTGETCVEVTENGPNLSPTITGNLEFCENDNTELALSVNYVNYLWSNGATTPTIIVEESGTYSVTVTDNTGNTGATSEMVIENPLPLVSATASNDIDCSNQEALLSGEGSETGTNISYNWQNQGNSVSDNLNFSTSTGGTYTLIVTNLDNSCAASKQIIIEENTTAPELPLAANQTLPCDGSMEISPISIPAGNVSYEWTNANGNPIQAATTATPSVEISGTYEVFITDNDNGCTNTNQIEILANESTPTGLELSLQNPTCFGDLDGQILIENVIEGDGPFLFAINNGAFSENMIFENLPAGSFELNVESQTSGCIYTEMVILDNGDQINLDLGTTQTINLGETIELGASFIDENIVESVLWETTAEVFCDTCLTNPFLFLENTIVSLTVTSENGCIISDQIQILVEDNTEIFAPNVFSPNNDGINDRFTIYSNNETLNVSKLAVFDRWGSLVFETNNIVPNAENLGWDGQFNGKSARSGLYVYMAEVEYLDGRKEVRKGDILLLGSE